MQPGIAHVVHPDQSPSGARIESCSAPDWAAGPALSGKPGRSRAAPSGDARAQLARELHDTVSQTLYGIVLGAQAARDCLEESPERARTPIDFVLALADRAMYEIRAVILDLRPDALLTDGLSVALSHLVADMSVRGGSCRLETSIETIPAIAEEVQVAVYRIAAEALHNAHRHARAGHIQLLCALRSRAVVLEVIDDGVGFDSAAPVPGHLGLASMRERARAVGCELQIDSSCGTGTTVRVTAPLPASC